MVSLFEQFRLLHAGWRDVLQIAIVSFVIYRVLLLVHRTRALQVLVGLLLLAVSYGVAYVLQLGVIVYLLTLVSSYGVIALLVVFAPEIRAALAQLGRSRFSRVFARMKEAEVGDRGLRGGRASQPQRRRRDHRRGARGFPRRVRALRVRDAGEGLGRPAHHDLHAQLSAARWRGHHPRRHDRRRGVHPSAVAGVDDRSLARDAAPRGVGPYGRNGRSRVRGVGTNRSDRGRIGRTVVARLRAGRRCATSWRGVPCATSLSRQESPSRRDGAPRGASRRRFARGGLRRHSRAGSHVLGCRRVHRRRAQPRHSASARHPPVRRAPRRVGEAPCLSAVRRGDESLLERVQRGRGRSYDPVDRSCDERAARRTRRGNCGGRDVHRLAECDGDGGLRGVTPALGRRDRRRGSRRPHWRRSLHAAHGVSPRAGRARALERARRRTRSRTAGGEPTRRRLRRPHGAGSLGRERGDSGSRTHVRVGDKRGIGVDPPRRRTST